MAQLERDLQIQVAEATRFKIERDNMHQTLKENEDIKRSPRKPALSSSLADVSDSLDNPVSLNNLVTLVITLAITLTQFSKKGNSKKKTQFLSDRCWNIHFTI